MTTFKRHRIAPLLTLFSLLFASQAHATEILKKFFDLPAGPADGAIKRFSDQAGLGVFYPSEVTEGVRTAAVRGEMTARKALDAMFSGTGLVAVPDEKTGAFSVRRASDPNAQRATPAAVSVHPDSNGTTKRDAPRRLVQEAVKLSPFVVNTTTDDGWLAGTTMLSNRTNQSLKDVPASIDALTQEFLNEVGAFDDAAAMQWAANVYVAREESKVGVVGTGENGAPDFGRITIRGIASSGGTSRNFFRWFVPNDLYNVERLDVGRGSNTLLFGDNEPGGQGTVYTKRAAIGRSFGSLLSQGGSFDSYRFNFDYNKSISNRLALRINSTASRSQRDFDFNKFHFRGSHSTVTYRPFENTAIRVEGELGNYDRAWGTNRLMTTELTPPGLGYNNKWTYEPQTGKTVNNTQIPSIDSQGAPSGSAALSLLDINPGGFPRHYNWGGPDQHFDRRFTTASTYIEQSIGGLRLELALNQQKQWFRENGPEGGSNMIRRSSTGQRFIQFYINHGYQENLVQNVRGSAMYNYAPFAWISQLFVASWEMRSDRNRQDQVLEKNALETTGALNGLPSRVWYRIYVDDPAAYNAQLLRSPDTVPTTDTFSRVLFYEPAGRTAQNNAHAYSFSATGKYFGSKLQTLVGMRWDGNVALDNIRWSVANRNARGEQAVSGYYDEHPERFSSNNGTPKHTFLSRNFGLVYALTPDVNAYVSYATSFKAGSSSAVNFINRDVLPREGSTYEAGLKSRFINGKLVWDLAAYDLVYQHVSFSYTLQGGLSNTQLEDLFNPNSITASDPSYLRIANSSDERQQYSKGIESTFIYYPVSGFTLRFAGSYKRVIQDKAMVLFKSLLTSAVARGNENPAYIAAAQQTLIVSGLDGREVADRGATRFGVNYATSYRFDKDSALKGFSVGLNGSYNGNFILGYDNDGNAVRGGKQLVVNGSAGYHRRIWGRPTTFRLNLQNLDESEYLDNGLILLSTKGHTRQVVYGSPFSAALTVTIGL